MFKKNDLAEPDNPPLSGRFFNLVSVRKVFAHLPIFLLSIKMPHFYFVAISRSQR